MLCVIITPAPLYATYISSAIALVPYNKAAHSGYSNYKKKVNRLWEQEAQLYSGNDADHLASPLEPGCLHYRT